MKVRREERDGNAALGDIDEVTWRQEEIAGDEGRDDDHAQRREDPPRAPLVEFQDGIASLLHFADQDLGNEEARDDEEDVDPDIATGHRAKPGVEQHNGDHRQRAQAVDVGAIALNAGRCLDHLEPHDSTPLKID